jgi:hypothetical protein
MPSCTECRACVVCRMASRTVFPRCAEPGPVHSQRGSHGRHPALKTPLSKPALCWPDLAVGDSLIRTGVRSVQMTTTMMFVLLSEIDAVPLELRRYGQLSALRQPVHLVLQFFDWCSLARRQEAARSQSLPLATQMPERLHRSPFISRLIEDPKESTSRSVGGAGRCPC